MARGSCLLIWVGLAEHCEGRIRRLNGLEWKWRVGRRVEIVDTVLIAIFDYRLPGSDLFRWQYTELTTESICCLVELAGHIGRWGVIDTT